MTGEPTRGLISLREGLLRWAELTGLWSLAVAYPIFDAGMSGPEGLTSVRADRLDVIVFALLVVFLVPTILVAVEILAGLISIRIRMALHSGFIGLLAGAFILRAVVDHGWIGYKGLLVALVVAGLIALAYSKSRFLQSMVSILVISTPVVLGAFALSAPASAVLTPESGSTGALSPTKSPPVTVLILDEFPIAAIEESPDKIDAGRFPNFAALARESTWYSKALTSADSTVLAVPSVLTGEEAKSSETPPGAADYPDNFFTFLDRSGYNVYGSEWITDLCPHDVCPRTRGMAARQVRLLTNGLTFGRPVPLPGDHDLTVASKLRDKYDPRPLQGRRVDDLIQEIEEGGHSGRLMHLMLPHVPWVYLPDGRTHNGPLVINEFIGDDAQAKGQIQQMLLQTKFLDASIGRIVGALKSSGDWEDGLFIVVADHGGTLDSGPPRRTATPDSSGWILPVPLFVKYPGRRRGTVVDKAVSTSRLMPTVLDQLGLDQKADPSAVPGSQPLSKVGSPLKEQQVSSTTVDRFTIGVPEVERRHRQAIEHLSKLFPDPSLYASSGHQELIGKKAEGEPGLRPAESTNNQPWLYEGVDLEGPAIPAYINGTVTNAGDGGDADLAIALNGRIAGTARSWDLAGVANFGTVVDPRYFIRGRNVIEVYEIAGTKPEDRNSGNRPPG